MRGGRAGDWSDDYIDQRIEDSTWPKYEDFVKELKVWFEDGDKIHLAQTGSRHSNKELFLSKNISSVLTKSPEKLDGKMLPTTL